MKRLSASLLVVVTALGLISGVSSARADERETSAPSIREGSVSPELGVAARRSARTGTPVRLIVDASARADLEKLGLDVEGRIGSLPQFLAQASAATLAQVIQAGLAHAVTVDAWIPRPRLEELTAAGPASSPYTDAAGIVGADSLRQSGTTGAGTAVAVIDTGIDASHPYFKRGAGTNIVAQGCFVSVWEGSPVTLPCPGNQSSVIGPDAANVGSDPNFSHGTHVAGIVAGNPTEIPEALGTWGIAPGSDLVVARVFGFAGALSSDVIRGLDWVASVAEEHNVVAANLSLGTFMGDRIDCTAMADTQIGPVVRKLAAAGVALVASTGNSGSTTAEGTPACGTGVVSVGATEADGTIAGYSNIAPTTDLVAPGSMILSSINGGGFGVMSGTSMAAPVVSGSFALAHQAREGLANDSWLSLFRADSLLVNDVVVKGLPLIQVDAAARRGAGIELPDRPTNIVVTEMGLSRVAVSWQRPATGPAPDDYAVTVGNTTIVTTQTSVTVDRVFSSPAPVTVVGRVAGTPGIVGQGDAAFPVDMSLGTVVEGGSFDRRLPEWDYCQPKAPGISLIYSGPEDGLLRTLRVTNGSAVQVVTESALSGSEIGDRTILITNRALWTDPQTVVQVIGDGGRLGPRWSLGSLVANAEQYGPPPPQPTQVRAASRKGGLTVSWAANGASAWQVYVDGRSVKTVTNPRAQVAAPPGRHTVGVCALGDSASQVRGSIMVTARGQALR